MGFPVSNSAPAGVDATNITGVLPRTKGGTEATTATGARASLVTPTTRDGLQRFSADGGGSAFRDAFLATPSGESQIGLGWYGSKVMHMFAAGSTALGDWKHGFIWPSGFAGIGDPDNTDPNCALTATWHFNGTPSLWAATGDALFNVKNWSSSANSSGSGYNCAVMRLGAGVSAVGIANGGTGYVLGDILTIAGGTTPDSRPAIVIVSSVSGGVITGLSFQANGGYTSNPATPNSPTGGTGSGASITLTFSNKAVTALPDNGCSFQHVPHFAVAALIPGNAELVFNKDNTYNKGLAICAPTLSGFDGGNYSLVYFDFKNALFRIPKWVASKYQPDDAGWIDAFQVNPATGRVTTTERWNHFQTNGEISLGGSTMIHAYSSNGGQFALCNPAVTQDYFFADNVTGMQLPVVGQGLWIKEGTNATSGLAVLVAGTKVVTTTKVTASSRIQLTSNVDGGTPGFVRVSARTAGTSFTITSSNGADTSSIAWTIIEPL